jgi:hypothetical protein
MGGGICGWEHCVQRFVSWVWIGQHSSGLEIAAPNQALQM